MTKMKGWLSAFKSKDSDDSRILFVVFEDAAQKKNLLSRETLRHRLAYAQAKNPKAMIVSADIMSRVQVGHNLSVTSDKPTFMAINLKNGTFREHKGKLTNVELDKFVRQVESGHLNIVRKLQSHFQSWKPYADDITSTGEISIGAIIGKDETIWAISGGTLSSNDTQSIVKFVNNGDTSQSITVKGVTYETEKAYSSYETLLKKGNLRMVISTSTMAMVVGFFDTSQDLTNCRARVERWGEFLMNNNL